MALTQRHPLLTSAFISIGLAASSSLMAWDGLVEKQTFELENFTTQGGETIPEVSVGWEAYGELNDARDNVILITHFSRAPAMRQAAMILMASQPAIGMRS